MNRFYKLAVLYLLADRAYQKYKSLYRWKCDTCGERSWTLTFGDLDNIILKHQTECEGKS